MQGDGSAKSWSEALKAPGAYSLLNGAFDIRLVATDRHNGRTGNGLLRENGSEVGMGEGSRCGVDKVRRQQGDDGKN